MKFPGSNGRSLNTDQYPLLSSSRDGNGLKVTLSRNEELFYSSECLSHSFLVHSPFELPSAFEKSDMIEFDYGYDFEILITPEMIKTDDDLRSFPPEKRGCYFANEKKLKYFKFYTRRHCEYECVADYILSSPTLNCTPYYMIRYASTQLCDYKLEYRVKQQMFSAYRGIDRPKMECDCMEECDVVKYNFEIIKKNLRRINETFDDYYSYDKSSFTFKFKDTVLSPLRRYRVFTFSDLLAQSGGMMGLFAGISVLSIVELLYFITFRNVTNFIRWVFKK
jgi:acid-sensing ion channel, other